VFLLRNDDQHGEPFAKIFEETARSEENKNKAIFVYCGITDAFHHAVAEFLDVEKSDLPAIRIMTQDPLEGIQKYVYEESVLEMTVEKLTKFVDNVLNGDGDHLHKSEEIPEKNDGPVTIIVGDTFDEIVMDGSKDVFLKLNSATCTQCQDMAPTWQKLGEHY